MNIDINIKLDSSTGMITISDPEEERSKYMVNNLEEDSILLDLIRRAHDDTDRAQLKLCYPELYNKLFIDLPGTIFKPV
tara:strand:- start:643 stop:879 length:237 start_codon:yes stop_codon:yes gene_type:complete